jgi:hypothetical protein
MKAGEYYVGDLCYVLADRWDEVCDLTIKDHTCLEGEFELSDGTKFAMYGTAWGDGVYQDQEGNPYPVDSGTIGCVLWSEIDPGKEDDAMRLGILTYMYEEFETGAENGVIRFGEVEIDTNSEEEWDEEEDDEE